MNRVYILPEVHAEIMFHVHKSDIEVSGLGRITKTSTGDLVVTKCYLLKQENSAVTTDIDPEAMSALMYETREDVGDLNFWWHSHVEMGVTWSGTDHATMKEFGQNGYLLSTVFNKRGEHTTAYYQGATDFLPHVFVNNIPTSFGYLPSEEQARKWNDEHEEKCTVKKYNTKDLRQRLDDMGNFPSASQYSIPDDDGVVMTYSGETLDAVVLEAEQMITRGMAYNEIHSMDQFYWWDMYEHIYGAEPTDDIEVEKLYTDCVMQPHLLGMLIFNAEEQAYEQAVNNHTRVHDKPSSNGTGNKKGVRAKGRTGNKKAGTKSSGNGKGRRKAKAIS